MNPCPPGSSQRGCLCIPCPVSCCTSHAAALPLQLATSSIAEPSSQVSLPFLPPAWADVLAAQPRRRAGVQLWQGLQHLASLQLLRLERQAGAGMPANALACRRLRGLTLIACEAGEWPAAPYQLSECFEHPQLGASSECRFWARHATACSAACPAPPASLCCSGGSVQVAASTFVRLGGCGSEVP